MEFNYKKELETDFSPSSRVWIYQSNREFTGQETIQIKNILAEFTRQWQSHGVPVVGAAHVFFNRFIILMADETATGVSGCSTDSSVRMIKEVENKFKVDMFERTQLAIILNGKIELLSLDYLQSVIKEKLVTGKTPYFNNLVQTKEELENGWIIPIEQSWLMKKVKSVI
jgi:hypothetical protein